MPRSSLRSPFRSFRTRETRQAVPPPPFPRRCSFACRHPQPSLADTDAKESRYRKNRRLGRLAGRLSADRPNPDRTNRMKALCQRLFAVTKPDYYTTCFAHMKGFPSRRTRPSCRASLPKNLGKPIILLFFPADIQARELQLLHGHHYQSGRPEQDARGLPGRRQGSRLHHPHVKPGVTTGELDRLCLEYLTDELKVKSATVGYAPPGYPPFPGAICTSVNHQVCHGVPGDKVLKTGTPSIST